MTLSDIEHFATIISGCEAISRQDYKSGDSLYAQSVLKLQANDMGSYAGQEGFLDGIKAAAGKAGEWIKKLIAAIRGWLTTAKQSTKEVGSEITSSKAKAKDAVVKADPETKEKIEKKAEAVHKLAVPQIKGFVSKLENLQGQMKGDAWDKLGYTPKFEEVIKSLNAADKAYVHNDPFDLPEALNSACASLEAQIDALTTALDRVSGSDEERLAIGKAVGNKVQQLGNIAGGLSSFAKKAAIKVLDAFMTGDKPITI